MTSWAVDGFALMHNDPPLSFVQVEVGEGKVSFQFRDRAGDIDAEQSLFYSNFVKGSILSYPSYS